MANWVTLVNYSTKYKVSVSTLRRKIKFEEIQYKLDSGRYFILDEAPIEISKFRGASLDFDESKNLNEKASNKLNDNAFLPKKKKLEQSASEKVPSQNADQKPSSDASDSIIHAANRLVDEIKKAYTLILQEKDEQVKQLREEISDLKTLVRVLEGEVERHRQGMTSNQIFD